MRNKIIPVERKRIQAKINQPAETVNKRLVEHSKRIEINEILKKTEKTYEKGNI